jgi:hypothetical protein
MSNYGKVKTFRLDKDDEKLLNECFKMLNVPSDKFSPMMSTFIRAAYRRLEEIKNLREKVDSQTKEIKEQERQIWEREREITLLQPSTPAAPAIMEEPNKVEDDPKKAREREFALACKRDVETDNWEGACKYCERAYPSIYDSCDAPQKPTKVEAITPTQTVQNAEVFMKQPEEPKEIEKPKPIREPVKFSSDGMSVLCKGRYYDNWIGKNICAVCQDKECEIKKGTVTFPKPKVQMQYPLKRW